MTLLFHRHLPRLCLIGVDEFWRLRLLHALHLRIVLESIQGLRLGDLHIEDLLFEKELAPRVFQRAESVALGRIQVVMEEDQERKHDDERTDDEEEQHGTARHHPAERVSARRKRTEERRC